MPFELANALRNFQKIMLSILRHLDYGKVFLDNILIYFKNAEAYINHLKTVIDLLKNNKAE